MKEALAIRYGGLLVPAEDCDYNSFKTQGLLCPCCKNSVFLVAEHKRKPHKRKGKDIGAAKVPTYFAHHPDTSESQVTQCELRMNSMSQADKASYQVKAKNQRRKILQANLWKMIQSSILMDPTGDRSATMESLFVDSSGRSERESKALLNILTDNLCSDFRSALNHSLSTLDQGIEAWVEQSQRSDLVPEESMQTLLSLWRQKLNKQLQIMIVGEVAEFICQKMQVQILKKFVHKALYSFIVHTAYADAATPQERIRVFNKIQSSEAKDLSELGARFRSATRLLIGMGKQDYLSCLLYIRDDILQTLAFINWSEQFALVEDRTVKMEPNQCQ